jgi:HTH-type transcriptional regulator/antitoxin HigA
MIDELTDRKLAPDEKDYLDVLSDLVERFETERFPLGPVSDADMLGHLMEAKGVRQAEVARATKIAESTISEVLSGKRSLNRLHITRLAAYFHVKPEVFFGRRALYDRRQIDRREQNREAGAPVLARCWLVPKSG